MDNKPLVSICTPVYNGEDHIEDCIKGVLNQTYENFEYCSGIHQKNVIAVQFHPEKSAQAGLTIYENFKRLIE